jgi:hypothetical protein
MPHLMIAAVSQWARRGGGQVLRVVLTMALVAAVVPLAAAADAATADLRWTHAHAAFGEPKYPPGFAPF